MAPHARYFEYRREESGRLPASASALPLLLPRLLSPLSSSQMYPIAHLPGRSEGGWHEGGNPFDLRDSPLSLLTSHMDSMMNGMMGPSLLAGRGFSRGSAFGGGRPSPTLGAAGGGAVSFSSCSYSCSSGPGGRSVQYSSSSHGVQRPGEEMVHETHRNYMDSSGHEKIGVSRGIGNRGRSIVAERKPDGSEERTDNLLNVSDGTSFDREWSANATSQHVTQAHTLARSQLHRPTSLLGGGVAARSFAPQPAQTSADRAAARQGHNIYNQQRERLLADARAQRQQLERQSQARPPSHGKPQVNPPPQLGYRPPSASRSCRGSAASGDGNDAHYASRLAQREARRAGLY
ncbi:hypothetical protein AB1Y20_022405 [Prymnesium parvum]|uniref:Uncharacterized protein n=1 Tax=Prymnesium parvum TaxID=97485 RepID=A0AB34JG29_PRYPA